MNDSSELVLLKGFENAGVQVLRYGYRVPVLAKLVADPLLSDRLDFFGYVETQQSLGFKDFMEAFSCASP